jgi:hypothetical protein
MKSIPQQIRHLQIILEGIENHDQEIELVTQEIFETAQQELEEASTTIDMIRKSSTPEQQVGGKNIAKYLHRFNRLGSTAAWTPHDLKKRVTWEDFKREADNILLIKAERGWAFYKPVQEKQQANKAADNNAMPRGDLGNLQDNEFYVSTNDGKIMTDKDIEAEIDLLDHDRPRKVDLDGKGRISAIKRTGTQLTRTGTVRGGKTASQSDNRNPHNMWDIVRGELGKVLSAWIAGQREDLENPKFTGAKNDVENNIAKRLGLPADRSEWSLDDRNLFARARETTGVALGQKNMLGTGASIEQYKMKQRRDANLTGIGLLQLQKRLHRIAEPVAYKAKVDSTREGHGENATKIYNEIANGNFTLWDNAVKNALNYMPGVTDDDANIDAKASAVMNDISLLKKFITYVKMVVIRNY